MEKTNTYTYFSITSNGVIDNRGLVGYENGIFNPDDITKMLGIEPFRCWKKGDKRKNGTEYLFSSWSAEKSDINRLDIESQCMQTINNLKCKIPILKEIKNQYNVDYAIIIVPNIFGAEPPLMRFNKEIINFCYHTDTTIEVDMYLFPD